jgi:hypothetical protein
MAPEITYLIAEKLRRLAVENTDRAEAESTMRRLLEIERAARCESDNRTLVPLHSRKKLQAIQ